jgi:hypothetical protein
MSGLETRPKRRPIFKAALADDQTLTDARSALARVTPAVQERKPREAKAETAAPKAREKVDVKMPPPKEAKKSVPEPGNPAKPAATSKRRDVQSLQYAHLHKERKKPAHVAQKRSPRPIERSFRAGTRFTDIWVDRP